jgi:hypothetical protein
MQIAFFSSLNLAVNLQALVSPRRRRYETTSY